MSTIYEEYAILEAQKKDIEARQKELREDIQTTMLNANEKKKETNIGSFSISTRKTWKYPQAVTDLEEDLKVKKAKAQSTGEASYTETPSLRFTSLNI